MTARLMSQDLSGITAGTRYYITWIQTNSSNSTQYNLIVSLGSVVSSGTNRTTVNATTYGEILTAAESGTVTLSFSIDDGISGSPGTVIIDTVTCQAISADAAITAKILSGTDLEIRLNGTNNIGLGDYVLYSATGANDCIGIGTNALKNNVIGDYNIAIGTDALASSAATSNNIAIGLRALTSMLNGGTCVAIGLDALRYNLTGYEDTALGTYSLVDNTTGYYNVGVGNYSLRYNTTGNSNVAVGRSCLYRNTTGTGNIAVGYNAIGSSTGANNYTANGNTMIGYASFYTALTGDYNAGVGYSALYNVNTGIQNAAFGPYALYALVAGDYNCAIGYAAGRYYSNGAGAAQYLDYCTYIGRSARASAAGTDIAPITNEIAIGYDCIGNGSYTVTLGNTSILNTYLRSIINITVPDINIVAGEDIGRINFLAPYESSGTDAILPGAAIWGKAEADFTSTVNATSLIFATGASETAAEKMRITSTGLVGIGNITPTSLLDLQQAGTAKAITNILEITNSGNAADMDGTGSAILFNQYYYDASTPAVVDAGRIIVASETDWTSTASTQDSYMSFETALDGTVSEKIRISSTGTLIMNSGAVRLKSYTYATRPTGANGDLIIITDSSTKAWGEIADGSGSYDVLAVYINADWKIIGY